MIKKVNTHKKTRELVTTQILHTYIKLLSRLNVLVFRAYLVLLLLLARRKKDRRFEYQVFSGAESKTSSGNKYK